MKDISERLKETLDKSNFNIESVIRCIEFTEKMKGAGLLRKNRQSSSNIADSKLNQLKLYAESSIMPYSKRDTFCHY